MIFTVSVVVNDPTKEDIANTIAKRIAPEQIRPLSEADYWLVFDENGVRLENQVDKKQGAITVDFAAGKASHRRQYGGGVGQLISKAIGLSVKRRLSVFDATAGLGGDSFVLASLGATVTMMEYSPIAFSLLHDGLQRAKESGDDELNKIADHMTLLPGESSHHLSGAAVPLYDVIYLDPMFPEKRKKKSAVKKEMAAFQGLVTNAQDEAVLLQAAIAKAKFRVVVKRPVLAKPLDGAAVTYVVKGKTCRYDVYVNAKIA